MSQSRHRRTLSGLRKASLQMTRKKREASNLVYDNRFMDTLLLTCYMWDVKVSTTGRRSIRRFTELVVSVLKQTNHAKMEEVS